MTRAFRIAVLFAIIALVVGSCGTGGSGGTKPTVRIGSTNFSEQLILGEIYAQLLEANAYTVERKFNLGAREIVFPALTSGQIDMEVDYLATLLSSVNKNAQGSTDPKETAAALQKELDAKNVTVLDYAPAVDQNGFAVTKATADKDKLAKISDLGPFAKDMILGGPPECPSPTRPFCLTGLKNVYGLTFKDFKPLDAGGPLTVAALEGGQIDVGLLFTSNAIIAVKGFVLLDDDKHLQLSDNVAPVVRNDLLTKAGADFKTLINSVAPKLTTAELTGMNKQVGVDRKDPKDVAKDWLKKQGLIR